MWSNTANQKIYALDSLIDIKPLEDLHLKICAGIAKSKPTPSTRVIPHYEMAGDFKRAVDFKNNEISRISAVADEGINLFKDEELEIYSKLSYVEKRRFLELYAHGYTDGEFIRVRFTKNEFLKDKFATFYSDKTEWCLNTPHFPELIDWITTLPFIDIGRILIFVTHQYMVSDMHYDRRDDWNDGKHHFVWFNPFGMKKFFMVNGYEKEYFKTKVAFYDVGYLHGADPSPYTTYTVRVDGQLSEDFCNKAGIKWSER